MVLFSAKPATVWRPGNVGICSRSRPSSPRKIARSTPSTSAMRRSRVSADFRARGYGRHVLDRLNTSRTALRVGLQLRNADRPRRHRPRPRISPALRRARARRGNRDSSPRRAGTASKVTSDALGGRAREQAIKPPARHDGRISVGPLSRFSVRAMLDRREQSRAGSGCRRSPAAALYSRLGAIGRRAVSMAAAA